MNEPKTDALELAPQSQAALARRTDDPAAIVTGMMQAVIEKGITNENVAAMKELVGLFERMQDRNAQQEFNRAFAEMQKEIPAIKATKPVPNNDGGVRYKFAPYEEIMEQVRPIATRHGFTLSFSQRYDGPRVFIICKLSHVAGHSQSNEFGARIGSGPPKSSEAQGDGAASTYAKRFALCNALNITIEADSDGRSEGAPISQKDAAEIESRIGNLKWDKNQIARFLKWLGAKTTDEIQTTRLADALRFIADKEKAAVAQ